MATRLDRRGFLVGASVLGGAVILGACGDDSDDSDDTDAGGGDGDGGAGGGDGSAEATLGLLPIVEVAPVFLAIEQGIFADHGVEITPDFAAGGAVILPEVEGGSYQLGFSNIVSLFLAQAEGGQYTLVAGGGLTASSGEEDWSQMWVLEDSDIESLADLGGQRVAINTLNNVLQVAASAAVDEAGGDWESINFREFPFPDMENALREGEVDAILHNEPFQTMLQQQGGVRSVGQPFADVAGGETLAFYFVKTDAAGEDYAVGFRDAMAEANSFAAENEDEVRAVLPTYLDGMDPELAESLVLAGYDPEIKRSSVERYAELVVEYGLLDDPPDVDALLG